MTVSVQAECAAVDHNGAICFNTVTVSVQETRMIQTSLSQSGFNTVTVSVQGARIDGLAAALREFQYSDCVGSS